MTLHAHRFTSPFDQVFLAVNDRGAIVHLSFLNHRQPESLVAGLGEPLRWDAERCRPAVTQLEEYFQGRRRTFDLPIQAEGTPFQRKVWKELQKIPYGETASYGEIAQRLGNPAAVRAVGRANGTNPVSLIIPCHRVIGANGTLTGYGGGLEVKRGLLQLEGAWS